MNISDVADMGRHYLFADTYLTAFSVNLEQFSSGAWLFG